MVLLGSSTIDPVHDVECAVGAKCEKVEGIDDGGNGRLTKQKQLRQNADRLENDRKCVEHLCRSLSAKNPQTGYESEVYLKWSRPCPAVEYERDDRRQDEGASSSIPAQLPCLLSLSRPRVDPCHQDYDVDGRPYVEVFENEVPP